uniref:Reverse transcriptase domain-containing protein n=1 Tax=Tanacetum cinerariifolium TaxID=118510 RepID=A0A6L2LRC0_TANCI|nr:reverse transcriptase domain-containing protein [Tanacetum cinerariifolium]
MEVPSFDKPEPQPQPLPDCPPLDASLGTERGLKQPIKPQSLDSFRMKVLDYLTIHTPPLSLVASFHLRDFYCHYRLCIDDTKKHYGFKPGLLGHSGSFGVDFSKLEMIDDDWGLKSKEDPEENSSIDSESKLEETNRWTAYARHVETALVIAANEAQQNLNVVTITFSLNDHFATVSFDSGVGFSFILTEFLPLINMKPSVIIPGYEIKIANGLKIETNKIVRSCRLDLEGHMYAIDLISFGHDNFNVIVGMDWLSKFKAKIVCHENIV